MNLSPYQWCKKHYLSLARFPLVRRAREWVRGNIQMRYWPWYDWKPWGCGVEKNPKAYKHELIVSLTSFPARIHIVGYAIRSLLKQSLKPNRVVLWLGEDTFPRKEADLPKDLIELKEFGLEIRWGQDMGPHTKLVHALRTWPEAVIVTFDDDWHYPRHLLRTLYRSYLAQEQYIHAVLIDQIRFDATGYPLPYAKWSESNASSAPLFRNVQQGFGGVLYPPHCLHPDVEDHLAFMNLSPTADDLWFWAMAVRAGTKIQRVCTCRHYLQGHMNPRAKMTPKLWEENCCREGNERCLGNILRAYPGIVEILKQEQDVSV